MESLDSNTRQNHESGAKLHQLETRWQIYLPFILSIVLIAGILLFVALAGEAIWQLRVRAIADWIYSILCLLPLLLCLLPLYLILLISIYTLAKLQRGSQSSLHNLEKLSADLAERINRAMEYVNEKTIAFNTATAPLDDLLSSFDTPSSENEELADDD